MEKAKKGFIAAASAMMLWGLLPVYWKQMSHVPAYEILSHRIVWSLLASSLLLFATGQWGPVKKVLKVKKTILLLMASGTIIGFNWLMYIWSVNNGYVLQCSLGYYINPLINVLLGFFVFKDRLRPIQWWAIALACSGVMYQVVIFGKLPWISLGLACSFAFYGLIRKIAPVESLPGLFIETAFISIPAGAFLVWTTLNGSGAFIAGGSTTSLFLAGTGIITSVPLLWFVSGAKSLSLITIGMLQYISPTFQFILGHWIYGEPFTTTQMITFGAIWLAIGIYTLDSILHHRAYKSRIQG